MKKTLLKIITLKNEVNYQIEIPQTEEEFAQGLAYRKTLSEKSGMLYYWKEEHPDTSMFTPETEIPVDFIFIDENGRILKISTAKPLSKELHTCCNSKVVLEVNAGDCKKYGIYPGDTVVFNKFNNLNAFHSKIDDNISSYYSYGRCIVAENSKNKATYMYSYMSHSWVKVFGDKVDKDFSDMIMKKFDYYKSNDLKKEIISKKQAEKIVKETEDLFRIDFQKQKKDYFVNNKTIFIEIDEVANICKTYVYGKGWEEINWLEDLENVYKAVRTYFVKKTSKEVSLIVKKFKNDEFESLNNKTFKFLQKPENYFIGEHDESLGNAWEVLELKDNKELEDMFNKALSKKEFKMLRKDLNEYIQVLVCPNFENPFKLISLIKTNLNNQEQETFAMSLLMEGYPNKLTIKGTYTWQNKLEGEVCGYLNNITTVDFYSPLFYKEYEQYILGQQKIFYLSALAYKIEKTKKEKLIVNKGALYELKLKEFLEKNPNKTAKDMPPVILNMGEASVLLNRGYVAEYEYQAPVLDVEYTHFGTQKITILLISVLRYVESDDSLKIKLYITDSMLKDYNPKVGDNIQGILWMNGYLNSFKE